MTDWVFPDMFEFGEWLPSPNVAFQKDASSAVSYNGGQGYAALTGIRQYGDVHWTPPGYRQDPPSHNATAADHDAAMGAALTDALSAPRNGGDAGDGYGARVLSASIVDHVGTPGWPLNDDPPHSFGYAAYVGHTFAYFAPDYTFPTLTYPDNAVDVVWESTVGTVTSATLEWSVPFNAEVKAGGAMEATVTVALRMSLNPADIDPLVTDVNYGTSRAAPQDFTIVLDSQSITLTENTSGISGRMVGSRTFTAAELAATNGKVGLEFTCTSVDVNIHSNGQSFDGWESLADAWSAGQKASVTADAGFGGTWYDDGSGEITPNYVRMNYEIDPPRHKFVMLKPDQGDGQESLPTTYVEPNTLFGTMGNTYDSDKFIWKWSALGGFAMINPRTEFGRGVGPMCVIPETGRLFVMDAGADRFGANAYYEVGQNAPLGYTLDLNLGDFQPVDAAYPLDFQANDGVPTHLGSWDGPWPGYSTLLYRPESGKIWYSGDLRTYEEVPVAPPEFHGYKTPNQPGYTSTSANQYLSWSWMEFGLDGTQGIKALPGPRADDFGINPNSAVYLDGWFYRWAYGELHRFNPSTGETQWCWFSFNARQLMGVYNGKIVIYSTASTLYLIDPEPLAWTTAVANHYYPPGTYPAAQTEWTTVAFDDRSGVMPFYAWMEQDTYFSGTKLIYATDSHPDANPDDSLLDGGPGRFGLIAFDMETGEWESLLQLPAKVAPVGVNGEGPYAETTYLTNFAPCVVAGIGLDIQGAYLGTTQIFSGT